MKIIARAGAALQVLFGPIAEEAAESSGVIVRRRVFSAWSLARTFILGYLQNPQASTEDLAQMAVQCGAEVTRQAIDQRHTPKLMKFLQELFCRGCKVVVGSSASLTSILERFTRVDVLDSSTITLPDSMENEFPGCGGNHGGGKAAMKLQVEWDLRGGALSHVEVEAGRSPDGASSRQQARRGKGSLRISDLGYFNLAVFAEMTKESEYFLSRLQPGTSVWTPEGDPVVLLDWLSRQATRQRGRFIDVSVLLGKEQRLPCRMIAWRLPKEQADRRRQKLRRDHLSKYGKEPSAERLAWCDWTMLVTNVPVALMSSEEAVILYRARWQVELLFKRWKSQDLVAALHGSTDVRKMITVWARLLAALVQHWLVVASAWDPTKSLSKVCEALRSFAGRLAAALDCPDELQKVVADLTRIVEKTCGRNPRTKAGTFELLNDVSRLDFDLN